MASTKEKLAESELHSDIYNCFTRNLPELETVVRNCMIKAVKEKLPVIIDIKYLNSELSKFILKIFNTTSIQRTGLDYSYLPINYRGEIEDVFYPIIIIHVHRIITKIAGNIEITVNEHLLSILKDTSLENLMELDVKHLRDHLPFKSFRITSKRSLGITNGRNIYSAVINSTVYTETDGRQKNVVTIVGSSRPTMSASTIDVDGDFMINIYDGFQSEEPQLIESEAMQTILNILLYMMNYTDMTIINTTKPIAPSQLKYNKKLNIFNAGITKPLEIGYRIGAKLNAFYSERDKVSTDAEKTRVTRTIAPHVKRAHWAKYYVGPRKDSNGDIIPLCDRQSVQRLKAPIFVGFNLSDELDLIATKRDLK